MKATADRINSMYVMTRILPKGAPRRFQANIGEVGRRYICDCKGSSQNCGHITALMTLLHEEAATALKMQPVPA